MPTPDDPLSRFGPATRAWFTGAFAQPTAAQAGAWEAVARDQHALVVAPTGSGKTLAAFLWSIDRIMHAPPPEDRAHRCRVLYVSPLKALAADVQRNLRSPLTGIRQAAARDGVEVPDVTVGMRTGDTPASERRSFATRPPDILVTTPESLFLILTSSARAGLAGVETVVLDEIHAVAGTKRGAHLALSLERLDALLDRPAQRIGLSATVRPVDAVSRFLGGGRADSSAREVAVVQPPSHKEWAIDVVVPVPDLADLDSAPATGPSDATPSPGDDEVDLSGEATRPLRRASVWPHVEERVVDLVADHTSTIVFTNNRRGAERLTARMNEVWAQRQGLEIADPASTWAALVPGQSGTSAGLPRPAPGQRGMPEAVPGRDATGQGETVLARAHHGSMSRAERTRTETELKEGRLPAVVATSSLELGIDMGAVDLVVQVGAPPSVASGLQRIGRAGHQVGAVSKGIVFPLFRGDLVPATVIAQRMRAGEIEHMHVPANPLDVLAQQIVAALAVDDWAEDDLLALVRRAAPFAHLGDATWRAVLDMLAGRYPSEDFAELRARITWDRATGMLRGRPGALRLAATSGGTIPDKGAYGVFLATDAPDGGAPGDALTDAVTGGSARMRGGKRVGELDEEMVYESRVGDTFTLGSSTWRIQEITTDRVLVTPAPGLPGRLPFWKGDAQGRPAELGRAVGAFVREADAALAADPEAGRKHLREAGLDAWAADNLAAYLTEQRLGTGRVPDDRTVVVERFRDELGDWRVVIHSPLGARVHAPWALVISARLRARFGLDVAAMHSDDGIVLRLPDSGGGWDGDPWGMGAAGPEGGDSGAQPEQAEHTPGRVTLEDLLLDPDEVLGAVRDELGSSVMFAARFREAAARALLLPRRRPDKRQPLWQQRQRSAQLLEVASQFPDFPIVLEAARECLQDDFDVTALADLMRAIAAGGVRVVEVTTPTPSPFAQSLLFGYTAQFLYDGDAPLAERRAAALSLDPELLAELLGEQGSADLADLLDPGAVERTEAELAGLAPDRQARDAEGLWDLLRRTGPHPLDALEARTREEARHAVEHWLDELEATRRVIRVRFAGVEQWAVAEDAGRLRDALGVALPVGIPETFTEPVPDPLGDLLRRHARTHGPFGAVAVAQRFGLGVAIVAHGLARLEADGVLARGSLRPGSLGGTGDEWCDPGVLRLLRRRSLAVLRAEVEPVEQEALGAFLPRWQNVSTGLLRGADGLVQAIEQLAGAAVPASALETLVLPARVTDYSPALLDELTVAGEVLWAGHSRLPGSGGGDGLVSLHLADGAPLTLPSLEPVEEEGPIDSELHRAALDLLTGSGGFFLPRVAELTGAEPEAVLEVLWDLVWAGQVTNDGLGALRERVSGAGAHRAPRTAARARPVRRSRFAVSPGRPASALRASASVPGGGGRWAALPTREADPTVRAHALTQVLLERHGVLTRSGAAAEGVGAGYRDVYRVLSGLEERGAVRRGYFVEHLGGSQFALPGAVDRLRVDAQDRTRIVEAELEVAERTAAVATATGASSTSGAVVLAAMDPANPYGAALAWPPGPASDGTPSGTAAGGSGSSVGTMSAGTGLVVDQAAERGPATDGSSGNRHVTAHRPGRKAGAVVVLTHGDLTLFVERGGRTVLSFTQSPARLAVAAAALARTVREGRLGRLVVQRVDGIPALEAARHQPVARALVEAGFAVTPRGLRISTR
ncbi:DEAD/DEAH box helicase [Promicromonospora iranensis]|uniref:ATP-dependent Lhr-like helicase n=1 Tax=Promicromonospora iranensis TaxID=1105144 RepID=A0ABU2CJE2_9MICO|nr:DEAD/DEAH box helicase [Promicromonospora iranensis]MDR7381460.1 ATP-dependent Lhr-like helicase [Promicromonospora iranensis]